MNTASARTSSTSHVVVFRDAFGERRRISTTPVETDSLDVLCFRPELTAIPSFEFALRERVSRLAGSSRSNGWMGSSSTTAKA